MTTCVRPPTVTGVTTDPLLAGPRGRRVCLTLAAADADHRAGLALMYATYHLETDAGGSVVVLTVPPHAAEPVPEVTPEEVAAHLAAAPVAVPDSRDLMAALEAAVDSARYWQEPDGSDLLAATPALQAVLARAARAVAASPAAAWWTAPVDVADQWRVTFDHPPSRTPDGPAAPAAATLREWRDAVVAEEETAARERPADPRAPWSGTWWSTPPAALTRTTRRVGDLGPAGLRLVEDSLGWTSARVGRVHAPEGARVLEIDGPDAWVALCRARPLEVTASRRHDWFRTTGTDSRWVVPDWSAVAADVDAVHVGVAGYLSTAGRALPVDDGVHTVLAGWGPDETVWLRDVPTDDVTERWGRDDDGDWRRAAE